eukprot:jgi/Mesen1/6054/ME000308S05245
MRHCKWAPLRAAARSSLLLLAVIVITALNSSPVHASGIWMKSAGRPRSLLAATCSLVVTTPNAPAYLQRLIAEPFKATKFVISYECSDGSQYAFKVQGAQGQVAFGSEVFLTYSKLGLSKIKVYACPLANAHPGAGEWCDVDAPLVGKLGVTVVYVRREIRGMSPSDRQDYFDAVKIMGNTSTATGRQIYGEGFFNYYEMVARHASFLYTQKCDLAHLGPAFMPAHRAFTNEFNRVIQLIKPHVSQPYWDYLSDGDLPNPAASDIWSNDYYGRLSGDIADEFIIKTGQFAYWRVPSGEEAQTLASLTWGNLGPSRTINPWGYFRGKENNNRARYVTRIGPSQYTRPLPKTDSWTGCRNITDFGQFAKCLDYFIHGGAHAYAAGLSGVPSFEEIRSQLDCTALDAIAPGVCAGAYNGLVFNGHFARGILGVDGCMVLGLRGLRSVLQYPRCDPGEEIKRIFNKAYYGDLASAPLPPFILQNAANFGKYGTCGDGVGGDYSDVGTSALDPIFWSHHTNIDRLLVSWRFLHPDLDFESFGFTTPSTDSSKYPDFLSATNILNPGTAYPSVYAPGDGNPTGVCYGHGLYDPICMGAFSGSFRSVPKNKAMTNLDVLRTVDVQINTPELENYVYDKLQG